MVLELNAEQGGRRKVGLVQESLPSGGVKCGAANGAGAEEQKKLLAYDVLSARLTIPAKLAGWKTTLVRSAA